MTLTLDRCLFLTRADARAIERRRPLKFLQLNSITVWLEGCTILLIPRDLTYWVLKSHANRVASHDWLTMQSSAITRINSDALVIPSYFLIPSPSHYLYDGAFHPAFNGKPWARRKYFFLALAPPEPPLNVAYIHGPFY